MYLLLILDIFTITFINPFQVTDLFLYPLKKSQAEDEKRIK